MSPFEPVKLPKQFEAHPANFEALARAFLNGAPFFVPTMTEAELAAQREYFRFLIAQTRSAKNKKPLLILEINAGTGASSVAWAEQVKALGFGGKVVCIDEIWSAAGDRNSSKTADLYRLFTHNIRTLGVERVVTALAGESSVVLAKQRAASFDIVFINGNPVSHSMADYIAHAKRLVRSGGIICGVDSKSRWSHFASQSGPVHGIAGPTTREKFAGVVGFGSLWAVCRQAGGWRQVRFAEEISKSRASLKVSTGRRNVTYPQSNPNLAQLATANPLYLQASETALPKTSITLPSVFPESLYRALENIRKTSYRDFEVIVVSPFMVSGPNIVWIQETEPKGAAYAHARAAEVASGDFVVAFSDDHRLVEGWDVTAARDLRELETRSGIELCCIGLQFTNWRFAGTVFGKYYANFPFMRRQTVERIGWIGEDYEKGFGDCDLSMRIWDAGGICQESSRPLIEVHRDDGERPKPLNSDADLEKFISRWAPKYGVGWDTTALAGFNVNIKRDAGLGEPARDGASAGRPNNSNDGSIVPIQDLRSQLDKLRRETDQSAASVAELRAQVTEIQQSFATSNRELREAIEKRIIDIAKQAADLESMQALDANVAHVHDQLRLLAASAGERLDNLESGIASAQGQSQTRLGALGDKLEKLAERVDAGTQADQALDEKWCSVHERLNSELAGLTAQSTTLIEHDKQTRSALEAAARQAQDLVEGRLNEYDKQTRSAFEAAARRAQELVESRLSEHNKQTRSALEAAARQAQELVESRLSDLTETLAVQSKFTNDYISGLAALLEMQAASIDQRFAERREEHEHIASLVAALTKESKG